MDPTVRYDLRPGEWRPAPPHVSYGCDRSGLAALLEAEFGAAPWASGESAGGPVVEVAGRTLGSPPTADDIEWLLGCAAPAPYGRGEETVLDPAVRDAFQIGPAELELGGSEWKRLRAKILRAVGKEMALLDAKPKLKLLKLLVYRPGGHFAMHADTEKVPGMVASLVLVLPGAHKGGALTVRHGGDTLSFGAGGADAWRWAAWYADCGHALEPVEDGVRVALTFAIAIDPEAPLSNKKAADRHLGDALWGRTYAEWHTAWAARGARPLAGNEQYGQKTVFVLSHRYTEPGLRASLLKGRDRDLARLLVDEIHGEAAYLAWLQIREVGAALTPEGVSWGDHTGAWYEPEFEDDSDPPPASVAESDRGFGDSSDPDLMRIAHIETPELHLEDVARQNVWVEDLRSLAGEPAGHGPIEVLDGEIVPEGALRDLVPDGARLYEATGNEGAVLELQYRSAVLVTWRRNEGTLRMLARCGGRRALAEELAARSTVSRSVRRGGVEEVLELWSTALATDGGGPEPRAHRLVLDAIPPMEPHPHVRDWRPGMYVEKVTRVDLDAEAVPTLVGWIRNRLRAGGLLDEWVDALGAACMPSWSGRAMNGAPALLRALVEEPETEPLALQLLARLREPATTREAVLEHASRVDEEVRVSEWRRRRVARRTADDVEPGSADVG